ncbi:MAG: phosphatase PAP2 family protein, partial [Planctomycetales bacterium]|nr:phosphatase PAP2 family protein [Planctomycetales bacterium]
SAYTTAFNEVKDLGSATSATRTAEQTNIAKFWADGSGTATPPGHINKIAQAAADSRHNTLVQNARLFAEINVAMADAAIMAWNTKFDTNFWRPVTAIRAADTDGNANTEQDAAWTPLLVTPPFPSYVSGHSSFSGAGAAVLKSFFGTDNIPFTLASEDASVDSITFYQSGGDLIVQDLGRRLGSFSLSSITELNIDARGGHDYVFVGNTIQIRSTIYGGNGNDVLFGSGVDDSIFGGAGKDVLFGLLGDDLLDGGDGDDWLFGGLGTDTLVGGSGKNRLY